MAGEEIDDSELVNNRAHYDFINRSLEHKKSPDPFIRNVIVIDCFHRALLAQEKTFPFHVPQQKGQAECKRAQTHYDQYWPGLDQAEALFLAFGPRPLIVFFAIAGIVVVSLFDCMRGIAADDA